MMMDLNNTQEKVNDDDSLNVHAQQQEKAGHSTDIAPSLPSQESQIEPDMSQQELSNHTTSSIVDDRRILNPLTPRKSAEHFVLENYWKNGMRSLQCVHTTDQFYFWQDNFYKIASNREIQCELSIFLNNSWRMRKDKITGEDVIVPFDTRSCLEREILDSVKNICSFGIRSDPQAAPSWIFSLEDNLPDPQLIVPFQNKLLSIEHFMKHGNPYECLQDITPKFFNVSQIPFEINPDHHGHLHPVKFIAFLNDVFDGDQTSIDFLQQWIGYCLTNMTWAQKILLMIGPPRSGKGTIGRILQTMLGEENFTAPTAFSLTERFPLEGWVNKRLAIMGDARFGDKKETVKEILLQVSGEDRVNIDRKGQRVLAGVRLPTKIMILSNEIPSIRDSGAALASRFMVLKMNKSFLGVEDTELFERDLKPEIPLIFWWALDGLRKLMTTRRFIQPENGKDTVEQLELYQSPIKTFGEEMCVIKNGICTQKDVLYNAYCTWSNQEGMDCLGKPVFCRQILSSYHSVKQRRLGSDGSRTQVFEGIGLKDRV